MSTAYYNELDTFASEWLCNLVAAGHIARGAVDSRSIRDVRATDFAGARQAHFFAGIGAWSYALRLAGWPDDAEVWTGSCPCQPFSSAGAGGGFDDERHLWPEWFRLIRECRPSIIFGEQVASPLGLAWLDVVSADLEGEGYAFGAADLCAAGVGAPHIRQRLVFVAYASGERRERVDALLQRWRSQQGRVEAAGSGEARALADDAGAGWGEGVDAQSTAGPQHGRGHRNGGGVGDADLARSQRRLGDRDSADECLARAPGVVGGFWSNAEWIACTDGKARPVEPGTFPLAHGASSRVGRLRGYGNAIVAEAVAVFIRAALEAA